jgi:hypothetical protein
MDSGAALDSRTTSSGSKNDNEVSFGAELNAGGGAVDVAPVATIGDSKIFNCNLFGENVRNM